MYFWIHTSVVLSKMCVENISNRVAEVGVLAETAKYPSMLAQSARLQIFATKKHNILQLQFLQHKRHFLQLQALAALR